MCPNLPHLIHYMVSFWGKSSAVRIQRYVSLFSGGGKKRGVMYPSLKITSEELVH